MKKILGLIIILVLGIAGIIYWQLKAKPSITLISPNGGEIIKELMTYTIKWNTKNIPATDKIAINIWRVPPPPLQEEGQEFDPIVFTNLENSGSVEWNIADMYPAGNYKLGITAYASLPITNPLSDESDTTFRIEKNVPWQTYTNEKFGYKVDYPVDWTFREFPDTKTGAGFRPQNTSNDIASECIVVDESGTAANEYNTPFADYVKKAAIVEIQNYEKLNSIEQIITKEGIVGYKTTWIYKDIKGSESISLPITYFENKKIDDLSKYKTTQIRLENQSCEQTYNQMISTLQLKK